SRFKLIREGMTLTKAREVAGKSIAARVTGSDPLFEAQKVREVLTDPRVARELMADPQVRHVIDEATPAEERAERTSRALRDPSVARRVVQDSVARSSMARAAKEMEEDSAQRQR